MAGWYKNRVVDHIDVNQAVRDAGKRGEAIALMAQGMKSYADTVYTKKRAKIEDAKAAATNAMKKYVADKGYAGKVDSAKIKADASDRSNQALLKAHKIDFNKERYKSDKSYRQAIDGKLLDIKKQKIASSGTVKAAAMRSGATRYKADKDLLGTKISSKTQLKVANINKEAKAIKANKKKTKLNLKDGMSAKEVAAQLRKTKKRNIDDFEVEF